MSTSTPDSSPAGLGWPVDDPQPFSPSDPPAGLGWPRDPSDEEDA
jgi:hypothetical protein